jgi:hypothetical protein
MGCGDAVEVITQDFDDGHLEDTHSKLLRLRHWAYAHRDVLAGGSFSKSTGDNATECYRLQVRVDNSGKFSLCSNAPELNPKNLPNVIRLCDVQSERVHNAVVELLRLVIKRKYPPGTYTAGIDFP